MEKAMSPHSSTLASKIPWTEEPGRLQSMGSLRIKHDWVTSLSLFTLMHWRRKCQPTPVFLPGESQGRGSLVGCICISESMGSHRVGHDWSNLAAAGGGGQSNELALPSSKWTHPKGIWRKTSCTETCKVWYKPHFKMCKAYQQFAYG